MTPHPTGRRERRGDHDVLVLERSFTASIHDVWAAVTEPERLQRWIGTWTGDPASGQVTFRMTAEGEDVAPETFVIDECDPPRLLRTHSWSVGDQVWVVELRLREHEGRTTLTFAQQVDDPATAADVGPGWEFYLDRLVAAQTGGDVAALDFERDYHPAMQEHYRSAFTR
jgi:uncharacterized protein YndB with AHSA1/START domain